jgi:hypothetical protein
MARSAWSQKRRRKTLWRSDPRCPGCNRPVSDCIPQRASAIGWGLATPGHVRALKAVGAAINPVFAQQSIREMGRCHRTPRNVVDDATWGASRPAGRSQSVVTLIISSSSKTLTTPRLPVSCSTP